MGTLFVVATPIGNLSDITYRAVEVLQEVDLVVCEDTRVTQKLLKRYDIDVKLATYHHHSDDKVADKIVEDLQSGKDIAYVSDAGTPGISDPGNKLVEIVTKQSPEVTITPIPGASAVISALSVSGFPTDNFLFKGFIPHKNKRLKYLQEIANTSEVVVFYESVHRIEKLLEQIKEIMPERELMVARELTKQFESLYRGNAGEVLEKLQSDSIKGEFVIVVKSI
ncbi:MAG: 16S rRNA (cytidine(1402)-2'-O)-methyltransferase [Patescibacteria group bacterium]